MRKFTFLTITSILALISSSAGEEKNSNAVEQAKVKTTVIIELAKANDIEKLANELRSPEESGITRHAATQKKVINIFKDVDLQKLKIDKSYYYKEKKLIILKIKEPIMIDLEYYYYPESGNPPKLQSLHP